MVKMNKETFIEEASMLGININDDILEKLEIYSNFLIEYNKHTNLTAIKEKSDIYLKHFYDSITILPYINDDVESLIDVGTGAGFPGIIIKLFRPTINVTLLDSNNKKINFLNELINKLDLDNIKTVHARSEEYALNNLDSYDCVVARAVKGLQELSELCLPLVKKDGVFISMKGGYKEELDKAQGIISKLNGKVESIHEFNLPIEDSIRSIIIIKKIDNTPKGYPRSYKEILKNIK